MMTSLSALTLEIYYRFMPLFQPGKVDASQANEAGPAPKEDKKDKEAVGK